MSARISAIVVAVLSTPALLSAQRQPNWPDSAWRAIGPASFGGRVDDIEAVAEDPRIIFVGTASGGVFRTLNNGTTWQPVFDAQPALSIGDIAIAPSDRNVIWVGTGEANNRQSSTWGDGVYRSLDGGTTWQNMGLRETQSIGRIVIDPRDANTVFVAAVGHLFGPNEQRGLYRTRNGGKSWEKVLGVDTNTGVTDVAMAADGRTLFAATYLRRRRAWGFVGGGATSGLWRSLDGGDSWQHITSGLPDGDVGRIGIDIAKSDPNIVYALIESQKGGLFRSTDRGATWTRQSILQERPSYFSQIRVDPKNPDIVPVTRPRPTMAGRLVKLILTSGKPSRVRVFSISIAMTIMTSANSASSFWPSTILPRIDPPNAPIMPAIANTSAQDHTTVPPRAWLDRLTAALAATAIALVPIATWGSGTPTT